MQRHGECCLLAPLACFPKAPRTTSPEMALSTVSHTLSPQYQSRKSTVSLHTGQPSGGISSVAFFPFEITHPYIKWIQNQWLAGNKPQNLGNSQRAHMGNDPGDSSGISLRDSIYSISHKQNKKQCTLIYHFPLQCWIHFYYFLLLFVGVQVLLHSPG